MELKNLLTPWNWFKKEEESRSTPSQVLSKTTDHPLSRIHSDIDKLFENFFQGFPLSPFRQEGESAWGGLILPQVDIGEGKKDYTIKVEVPGVDEKDIELTITDGTLLIRGEKRYEKEDHDKQYHRVERSYGAFQRMLSLPTDADESKIEAKFKNGVLTVTIAKNPDAKPPVRRIAIT
jgi:HSP20 family protein